MNQEITLSRNFVRYWYENPPKRGEGISLISKIEEFLSQNYIVFDNKGWFLSIVKDELKNLNINNENEYETCEIIILSILTKRPIPDPIEINIENITELSMATRSGDKIYFDPISNPQEIKKLEKKHNDVEIYNLDSFLNPPIYKRLKHIPTRYRLEKDVRVNLSIIIIPFIKGSSKLYIYDPYIYNNNSKYQLEQLFEIFDNQIMIEINALNKHKYCKIKSEDNYKNFINFIEQKKQQGFKITLNDGLPSKHKERYLLTDQYQIYLPGGLDFLDENNYPVLDNDSEIKEIRIDKIL